MEKLKLLKHSKKGFLNIKEKFKRKNIAICFFYKPFLKHKGTEKLKLKSEQLRTAHEDSRGQRRGLYHDAAIMLPKDQCERKHNHHLEFSDEKGSETTSRLSRKQCPVRLRHRDKARVRATRAAICVPTESELQGFPRQSSG